MFTFFSNLPTRVRLCCGTFIYPACIVDRLVTVIAYFNSWFFNAWFSYAQLVAIFRLDVETLNRVSVVFI